MTTQSSAPEVQEPSQGTSAESAPTASPTTAAQPALTRSSQQRFELKYWVPERQTGTVVDFGRAYLKVDPFHDADGLQRNTSLYLESPGLDFYRAHLDSAPDRAKLRVRVYGEKPQGPAFFELKRKVRSVIVKRRSCVPLEDMASILDGDYSRLPLLRADQLRNLEAFLYYQTIYRAAPSLLVTCVREAFASHYEDDVRLTIDREVAYQVVQKASFDVRARDWVRLGSPPDAGNEAMVLVEMKFRGVAPFWMKDLVNLLRLERTAFSKYVTSMDKELEDRPNVDAIAESVWT